MDCTISPQCALNYWLIGQQICFTGQPPWEDPHFPFLWSCPRCHTPEVCLASPPSQGFSLLVLMAWTVLDFISVSPGASQAWPTQVPTPDTTPLVEGEGLSPLHSQRTEITFLPPRPHAYGGSICSHFCPTRPSCLNLALSLGGFSRCINTFCCSSTIKMFQGTSGALLDHVSSSPT